MQHAHNPVDWYPWGEEAFARARAEDKPLLLSIGYSACHWCHVMERESFEDQTTATLMNERFVSIKVDREERPDLDEVYMTAVQGLTGHGGWPMTVFLTPEGKPFYGGTYFPPTDRLGMPSFPRVLVSVSEAYRSQREQVLKQADLVTSFVRQQTLPSAPSDYLDATALDNAFVSLARGFDSVNGGFGGAPKFPQAMALEFLLRYHARTGNTEALGMADLTLQRMALGGIYDHLGGGFHRYAVDERWLVPHFEKMLYDNALLARAYLHAFQITGRPLYREVVEGTLGYVLREMRDPEGGLYSTQDADSDGREGAYYVWTPAEVEAVLGPGDARIACGFYGVTAAGNFEGHTILTRPPDPEARAAQLGIAPNDLDGVVDRARASLLTARLRRVAPARDDKVLCAWNGLMLRTLAEAHRVLGADPLPAEPERPPFGPTSGAHSTLLRRPATAYGAAAVENARFLLGRLLKGDRLFRVYKDGRVKVPGYLEDYAALADGLLALYEATFDVQWFAAAQRLTDSLIDLFWEQDAQSFSDTARDAEPLVARPKERWDNATPSGMSLACHALLRLWALTGESRLEQIARASLASMAEFLGPHAVGLGNLLGALDFYLGPPTQVAVIGDPNAAQTASLLGPLRASYLPNVVVACADPRDTEAPRVVPLLAERRPVDERPAAYVCEGFVCRLPCTDPEALEEALGIRRHSGGTEIP